MGGTTPRARTARNRSAAGCARIVACLLTMALLSCPVLAVPFPLTSPFGRSACSVVSAILSAPAPGWPGRELRKESVAGGLLMEYAWRTPAGHPLELSFTLSEADLEDSERSFGYSRRALEGDLQALEATLKQTRALSPAAIAGDLVARIPFAGSIEFSERPDGAFEFLAAGGPAASPLLLAEIEELRARFDSAWKPARKKILSALGKRIDAYLEERALIRSDHGIRVRYDVLVKRSIASLKPIGEELKRMSDTLLRGRDLDAMLSFVQQIPSLRVPTEERGRYTAGCAVPLRVLADDGGDCDSKAVLFAALWLSVHNHPVALVMTPDHMLVGIAGSHADGTSITLNSVRYLLCEVCPDVPSPPGAISEHSESCLRQGEVKYKLISRH
jgi:hypothetical protein